MVDLIANKNMSYGTRRLVAEAPFSARTSSDARVLVALGHARYPDGDYDKPAKPRRAKKAKAAS